MGISQRELADSRWATVDRSSGYRPLVKCNIHYPNMGILCQRVLDILKDLVCVM